MKKRRRNDPRIEKILDDHERWIASGFRRGQRADFTNYDLSGAGLSNRNMSGARFINASLE